MNESKVGAGYSDFKLNSLIIELLFNLWITSEFPFSTECLLNP